MRAILFRLGLVFVVENLFEQFDPWLNHNNCNPPASRVYRIDHPTTRSRTSWSTMEMNSGSNQV